MIVVVILFILAVIVLGVWGAMGAAGSATTSATALTLATTNAVNQTTVLVLVCALLASVPLLVYGAFRLGALRAKRDAMGTTRQRVPHVIAIAERDPMLGAGQPALLLPGPRDETPTMLVPRARVRRTSRHTRQAAHIAQRWFR